MKVFLKMPDRMVSHLTVVGLLLISAFLNVASVNTNAFDCRRVGVNDCVSGQGTCGTTQTGVCECQSGFLSYDCSHAFSSSGSGCGNKCGDNAHCRSDNTCLCPETHYNGGLGTCEYKTLQNSCSVNNKILLNVNTPGVEGLAVFVEGREETCSLKSDGTTIHPAMPADWKGKVVAVDLVDHTNCGPPVVSTVNGLNRRCVTVYMRYKDSVISHLDKRITFCCQDYKVDGLNALESDVQTPTVPTTTTASAGGSGMACGLFPVLLCLAAVFTR